MTVTKLNILKKTKKYVFKTILKTAFKTCYNEVKSPRLKISDPPQKKSTSLFRTLPVIGWSTHARACT